jgi:pimeloyl-ACP methyl ester carboxylesterase
MARIDRDGVGIHYEVAGHGPAVLLTHGFSASSHMFAGVVSELATDHTVVTWDVRGHAGSDSPDDPGAYSTPLSIADMGAVLDAAGVGRAVVAGHSLGGYLSLEYRLAHPERVRALVLIGTGPGYRRDDAREGWNDMARRFGDAFDRKGLGALGSSEEVSATVHRDARGLAHAARGILVQHDGRVMDSLAVVDVPTLVIVGERDERFVGASRYMAERIAGAELVVVPDAGHAPNLSQPAAFSGALRSFLSRLPEESA